MKTCLLCNSTGSVQQIEYTSFFKKDGKEYSYTAISVDCEACKEIYDTPKMLDENLKRIREAMEK